MKESSLVRFGMVFSAALCLVWALACNGNGNGEEDADADAIDVPADEIDTTPDPVVDPQQEDTAPDPVEEDVMEEEAVSDTVEDEVADMVEEELPPVDCAVDTAGTASLGGWLVRGTNMILDTGDTDLDAAGDIYVAIFDQDPVTTIPRPDPVAYTDISAAVLTAVTDSVQFCIKNIPPGEYWLGALMDDDGSGSTGLEEVGDIIAFPMPTGTLSADEAVEDAYEVMNVRIGRVAGSITIDADLAATLTDLTGDLYVGIVDSIATSPPPTILGVSWYQDVTLSADAAQPYEVLLMLEPTASEQGHVIVIFDVDESGVSGFPQAGDIVNVIIDIPPTLPPQFTYDITGIQLDDVDTVLIDVYTP
jgi:hypothetical protein